MKYSLTAPGLVLALLAGCPDRTISAITPVQDKIEVKDFAAKGRRDVDILFVIDASGSMEDEQASLRANFGRFIAILESIEGGLPNVHIGVVTPDLGTSATDGTRANDRGNCAGDGEGGRMRALTGGAFIVDEADSSGGRRRNYTGTLADAFSEIATVGANGCGIEQHLEAMKRALDGSNAGNAGFLRPEAALAVVIVADEDDCSLAKSTLFTNEPNGEKLNFQCTAQGVECDEGHPDLNVPGARQGCHPKDDSQLISSVDRYVDFLKSLKSDPRDVVVAGILGSTDKFATVEKTASGSTYTILDSSCSYGDQVAFPAIRTGDFLAQFPNQVFTSICQPDLSQELTKIGVLIKKTLEDTCFLNRLLDADPETDGMQYDCSVVEFRRRPDGTDEDLGVVPPCETGAATCWRIEEDAEQCFYTETMLKLVVERPSPPAPEIRVRASCVTTAPSGGPVI